MARATATPTMRRAAWRRARRTCPRRSAARASTSPPTAATSAWSATGSGSCAARAAARWLAAVPPLQQEGLVEQEVVLRRVGLLPRAPLVQPLSGGLRDVVAEALALVLDLEG